MNYSDAYFAIASVSTIAVAGLLVLALFYVISILMDVKRLSKIAKKEAEMIARGIAKGASLFGTELSGEAAGFVRTVFALLLSHIAHKKSATRKAKVKSI